MTDHKNIPFLIDLLDDPSEEIRRAVTKELEAFGFNLEDEIRARDIKLDPERKAILDSIFEKNDRKWLKRIWSSVFEINDEVLQLETGLSYIADFQNGRFSEKKLSSSLDKLAAEFVRDVQDPDHFKLISFLFQSGRLKGADNDYYNPLNSNLVHVIEQGQGIPISLAAILILVGSRVGLQFYGCNFPGHFLGRFENPPYGETVLVDCFNGGKFIYEEDIENLDQDSFKNLTSAAFDKADSKTILTRVLGNLLFAYRKYGDITNSEFFEALLHNS